MSYLRLTYLHCSWNLHYSIKDTISNFKNPAFHKKTAKKRKDKVLLNRNQRNVKWHIIFLQHLFSGFNSLICDITKWSEKLWKSCSKGCKIFKACLTILRRCAFKVFNMLMTLEALPLTGYCIHDQINKWNKCWLKDNQNI